MTPSSLLEAFANLRAGSRVGQRLPHKPLLALLALGRWEAGDQGPIPFRDIEEKLEALIQTYGPEGAGSPQEPFWRLRRDGLWELLGTDHLAAPDAPAPPGLGDLRRGVAGQFTDEVRKVLTADPTLPLRLARSILENNFPPSLHGDIAAEVGLDVSETPAVSTASSQKRRRRDPNFRDRVLRAYGNRCALCRVKLHVGLTPFALGLEAAHIRWFHEDGPDHVTNGVAFCAFHHKAFDLGAFTVGADGVVLVSEHLNGDGADVLLTRGPLRIEPAAVPEDRPATEYLEWHRAQVFKGRVRGATL